MPHLEKKLKSIEEKFSKVKCFLKWMVSVLLQEVQRRGGQIIIIIIIINIIIIIIFCRLFRREGRQKRFWRRGRAER